MRKDSEEDNHQRSPKKISLLADLEGEIDVVLDSQGVAT